MVVNPIKVGVIGVGHLGQHHVKHFSCIKEAVLIGLFDIDTARAKNSQKNIIPAHFLLWNLCLSKPRE